MEQPDPKIADRLYWLDQVLEDDDRFEESSGARRPEEHHFTSVLLALETTAEHPLTDGVHTVRKPARKAFSLVWLTVIIEVKKN